MTVILSVILHEGVDEAVNEIARKRNIDTSQVITRAIAWLKFFDNMQEAQRETLLLDTETAEVFNIPYFPDGDISR